MSPFDIPERDTVSDLIGRSVRAAQSPDPSITIEHAKVYATLALARAIENGFSQIDDIGDALKTVAIEVGSVAQGLER